MNLAILQARMSSSRLPNKVLMEVNGKPLLQYECERLLQSNKIDELIIATSTDKSDDAIEKLANENNIEVFRGYLDDVLLRYYNCAIDYKYRNNINDLNIVRVTGDCPIIDAEVIDEVITAFEKNKCDYASNTIVPTFPDGMDIEILTLGTLEDAEKNATRKSDREHVTLYVKNCDRFIKLNFTAKSDFSHLRLTVDELNDFELIRDIIEKLYPINPAFSYLDVVSYMTKHIELFSVNSNIKRDEGLIKLLKENETYNR